MQPYETKWREQHPYKSMLFDMGLPNQALKELTQRRSDQETEEANARIMLAEFKAVRGKAQAALETVIQKALPKAEIEHVKRQERHETLQTVLKPIKEPEWALLWERDRAKTQERGGGGSIGF